MSRNIWPPRSLDLTPPDFYLWVAEKSAVYYSEVVRKHHVTRHNTPIHNILSTAPQLSISQKALGTLPEDGNVMSKRVGTTIHN
jgi:hypothetical protein